MRQTFAGRYRQHWVVSIQIANSQFEKIVRLF